MKRKWIVTKLNDEAAKEVASLFENEDVRADVERILKLLAQQDDPRLPDPTAYLIVAPVRHEAPTWYRVKVPRYAIRNVFRLLAVKDGHVMDITTDDALDKYEERYIDIMQATFRSAAYGAALRRRYRREHPDEE
jgi:hypothetical protein